MVSIVRGFAHRLPVPDLAHDTEGATRALRVIDQLQGDESLRGPRLARYGAAVESALRGTDSPEHYHACRLGAAIDALKNESAFEQIIGGLVHFDVADEFQDRFGHDEIVLHVAAQLRAVGLPVLPVAPSPASRTPDLECGVVDIEVKHRVRGSPNDPDSLGSFITDALKAKQVREGRAGVMVLDLRSFDAQVEQSAFSVIDGRITSRVRSSKRIQGVVLLAMKRGDPSSWFYVRGQGLEAKVAVVGEEFWDATRKVFPWGTEIGADGVKAFGVRAR